MYVFSFALYIFYLILIMLRSRRHAHTCNSIEFTPDGAYLLSGGQEVRGEKENTLFLFCIQFVIVCLFIIYVVCFLSPFFSPFLHFFAFAFIRRTMEFFYSSLLSFSDYILFIVNSLFFLLLLFFFFFFLLLQYFSTFLMFL